MNAIGQLGQYYNLSPGTLAGLANAAGQQPVSVPEVVIADTPAPPPLPPSVDPDSPEGILHSQQAAAAAAGLPPVNAPAESSNNPRTVGGVDPGPKPGPIAMQGPADDNFPTVKSMDSGSDQGSEPMTAPGAVVPAHWAPHESKVEVKHGHSQDALLPGLVAQGESIGAAELAATKEIEARRLQDQADIDAGKRAAIRSVAEHGALKAMDAQRAEYIAREHAKLEALNLRAQKTIDPDEAFYGVGGKLAAAIAVGLGQFAAMWKGGTNGALQIVDDAVRSSIVRQKANAEAARGAYSDRLNLYRDNEEAFGHKRAELATKIQLLDKVAEMADERRIKIKSLETDAAAAHFADGLAQRRANALTTFGKDTDSSITESLAQKFHEAQTPGLGKDKDRGALYVPTLGGYARDAETARKLNEKGALRMQITENMHQIYQLMDEAKRTSNPAKLDDINSRIHAKVSDSLTKNTVLEGQGAMSDGDKAVAAEAKSLKDVNVFVPNYILEKRQKRILDSADSMLTQHRLEGEAYGVQRGTERYVAGPNGPTPVARLEGKTSAPSKRTQGVTDLVRAPKGQAP